MPATHNNTLSFFVHRTRQIHSLPAVALEVLELTDHPRVDCRKLKDCIDRDPALVGKILRVVNSSLFGLGREVSDLNQALSLLGIKPLKLLVLGFSLSDAIFHGKTGEAMQHAWRHTLTRAVAARELCETMWHVPGDEAFTASLLSVLGKFVLLDELGEPYTNLLATAATNQENVSRLEQASLGFDHAELSAELLSHWGLPESLVAAVRLSVKPDHLAMLEPPDNLLPAAVYMAGLIADLLVDSRHDCLHELVYDPLDSAADERSELDKLRLTDEQFEQFVARVQDRIGGLADALSFELPPGQDYRDVLVAAHERLARLAADAAGALARQWPIAEKRGAEVAEVSTAVARYVNRFADETARTPAGATHAAGPAIQPPRSRAAHPSDAPSQPTDHPLDAQLLERLTTVVRLCRQARCSLSLVLLELDRFRQLVLARGAGEASDLVRRLLGRAGNVDHPGAVCLQLGEARFALVIADCDRRTAVAIGRQLLRDTRVLANTESAGASSPTLSVGVAAVSMPSKNFPSDDLLKAAARCLDAAQLSGGNTLKSIDVY